MPQISTGDMRAPPPHRPTPRRTRGEAVHGRGALVPITLSSPRAGARAARPDCGEGLHHRRISAHAAAADACEGRHPIDLVSKSRVNDEEIVRR